MAKSLRAFTAAACGGKCAMRNFVIFVQGENFNLEVDGKVQPAGFFATRRAEAPSEEEASAIVLNQLRNDPVLNLVSSNDSKIESVMTVKVVHEMPLEHENTYNGFESYQMEEQ